jgi:hypothetical protein
MNFRHHDFPQSFKPDKSKSYRENLNLFLQIESVLSEESGKRPENQRTSGIVKKKELMDQFKIMVPRQCKNL